MKTAPSKSRKKMSWLVLLSLFGPFLLFLLLITFFFSSIDKKYLYDASFIPNAFIRKPAPKIHLPLLNNENYLNSEEFKGRVTLVNFWGSWCPPCRQEHPILMEIAKDQRFDLIGINYKDNKDNAQRFLNNFGNPFKYVGFDASGYTAINWGIYGPPETFVLNKDSVIIATHIGPLTWQIYQQKILPKIEQAIATIQKSSDDKSLILPK
ncbi:hypothetical protein H704_01170 [Bartonella bacilliformis Peru38]|uniref:Thiol:disulfide interchange protein CycY n=2 Tax=Bartonella bacilliformis TaxID=774 RepID=A1UU84_BARBK|nr:DsbE family thiol:disulfide interchange protein [Bartonella bacilliformis]ABM45308.1 thiol:disulfide interchange protein CycY [Bartonella bacilliformis KC583]AMG86258.1 DsbE family thiol:disulfide interchange protein [Bartonella bacilliformis]EKS43169.1 thiol:disulfide interchange protein CycY [Bartonella bacilliformis INS]EYS88943.1 hypothetical protein X472_01032 [Bartonella bacilliformis San Pedro600-02]EYS95647.1 hypothetical protein X470_00237 [Bartonella bacilliformis Peru-18]